jgi:ribonuclease HI
MTSLNRYRCFFDGACEPKNPGGTGGFGAVIYRDDKIVFQRSGIIPASPAVSNNVAEYRGLLAILDWFIDQKLTAAPIEVFGDSQLVINQMFGKWRIRDGLYASMAREAFAKRKQFPNITGSWIPRRCNSVADDLSKAELRRAGVEFRVQPEEDG